MTSFELCMHPLAYKKYFFVSEASLRLPTWLTDESVVLPIVRAAIKEPCRQLHEWTIGRLLGIMTIPYCYVSLRIIRYNNSIITITIIIINSNILISPSHTAWTLFIIDWRRGVPNSSNIRQRWSINSRTISTKSSRLAT